MKDFASFDLVSLNLSIGAVDVVDISKSNHVLIIPDGNEVLVRKNRDFNFSGWFYAGKIEMDSAIALRNSALEAVVKPGMKPAKPKPVPAPTPPAKPAQPTKPVKPSKKPAVIKSPSA